MSNEITHQDPKYNHRKIELHWQGMWDKNKTYSPDLLDSKNPYYNLMMFPYPSAEGLHAGNMYAFTGADIWGRYQRMKGHDVFQPIGLDGFGIHSENYAIKIGKHPKEVSAETETRFYAQLHATGIAYDWDHTLETYDPDYYRWTQWLFVQMFKNGLAYRTKAKVNWCPSCKTVLADEQVISGECERCANIVEKKDLEQWFFKITDYAERLLGGLEKIDWTEKIKIAQRNWIGKKVGIEISYQVEGTNTSIEVFTTRPDTNFGATFIVLAPEHPFALQIVTTEQETSVKEYIKTCQSKTSEERIAEGREKTGVFTGAHVINNLNGEKLPVWISDFVLMGFGTGAVVGVPGHDVRDFEFATKYNLPIKRVVVGSDGDRTDITSIQQVQEEEGTMINSEFLDGLDIREATQKIMDYLEDKGWGEKKITYHLRDWLISRQRYWGPPIPMIYCQSCADKGESWFTTDEAKSLQGKTLQNQKNQVGGWPASNASRSDAGWYPVPEANLPVVLPYVENFKPTGTGKAPLAQDKEWVNVKCPNCGSDARRETDVSDTFLDSAWYYLRYPSVGWPENSVSQNVSNPEVQKSSKSDNQIHRSADFSDQPSTPTPWNSEITKKWFPVNMYIGGAEHSVLHLMYVRFVTMALSDWGYIDFSEPFPRFYAHGLLIKEGKKMSKSKGNIITPDKYIEKYGADTLRCYLMFLGPYNQGGDFRDTGIEGMSRFLNRAYRLLINAKNETEETKDLEQIRHKSILRVTHDVENLRYNRALAGIMEFVNELEDKGAPKDAKKTLVLLLAPFAPHFAEELWQTYFKSTPKAGDKFESIHKHAWPQYNSELVIDDIIEIPVQINGKLRGTVQLDKDKATDKEFVEKRARENEAVNRHFTAEIKKVIFVPGKLINFVV